MYDPSVGQFLSEDPIEFEGLDENLKRYVRNRTTDRTDPTGLQPAPPLTPTDPDGPTRLPPPPVEGRTPPGQFHYDYPTQPNSDNRPATQYTRPNYSFWNYTPAIVVDLEVPRQPLVFDVPKIGTPTLAELDAWASQNSALAIQMKQNPPKKANGKWDREKYIYTIPCAGGGTVTAIVRPKLPSVTFADGVNPIRDIDKIFKNPDLMTITGEGEFTIEWVR